MNKNGKSVLGSGEELLKGLDDLNLKETEKLLSGIDKVTLFSDEGLPLRAKVLEKAGVEEIGLTPELERRTEEGKRTVGAKNRSYMRRTAVCIAAMMVFSIVAIAATNMDGLQRFWGNDTEIYRDMSLSTVQSAQNVNVKVNIEGIVADKYQCVFVFSLEALTEEGRRMIKNADDDRDIYSMLKIDPAVKAGAVNQGAMGIFRYTDDNKNNRDYKAYQCDFELENVDLAQPVTVSFADLTMDFDIPQPMEAITLYPELEAEIESVDLSPIGYYYKAAEFAEEPRLIKKDGTLADLESGPGYFGSMHQESDEEVMMIGSFTELIDLNDYLGIRIDGINYTVKVQ